MGEISKKVQESNLKLYGHVLRSEEYYVGKRVMVMEVSWKRRRGSPKRKWSDNIRNDLCKREPSGDEAQCWKRLIRNIDHTYNVKGCIKGRPFLFT